MIEDPRPYAFWRLSPVPSKKRRLNILTKREWQQKPRRDRERAYITQQGGKYHFSLLDANVDYELRATHNSVWSGKKKLSLFSSKKQKTVNLKLKSP
jgi:hypothetical protein